MVTVDVGILYIEINEKSTGSLQTGGFPNFFANCDHKNKMVAKIAWLTIIA
jgi:hypothetical protein